MTLATANFRCPHCGAFTLIEFDHHAEDVTVSCSGCGNRYEKKPEMCDE